MGTILVTQAETRIAGRREMANIGKVHALPLSHSAGSMAAFRSRIPELTRGKISRFSLDTLVNMPTDAGMDIAVKIRQRISRTPRGRPRRLLMGRRQAPCWRTVPGCDRDTLSNSCRETTLRMDSRIVDDAGLADQLH
ncbi:MAG: XRE family transcriptional regulator [Bryobacterales bacterium]|nr:XRE family transcriptional regulator [Bryobacterales bacterium]